MKPQDPNDAAFQHLIRTLEFLFLCYGENATSNGSAQQYEKEILNELRQKHLDWRTCYEVLPLHLRMSKMLSVFYIKRRAEAMQDERPNRTHECISR